MFFRHQGNHQPESLAVSVPAPIGAQGCTEDCSGRHGRLLVSGSQTSLLSGIPLSLKEAGMELCGKRVDLKKWSIFAILDKEFLSQIRVACVFGNLGNEALMISHDDEVFAVGSNGAGCLGLGDMHSTLLPKRVEPLCYKGVSGFAYGSGPHVLAFTQAGELYSWGHNGYSQLGKSEFSSWYFEVSFLKRREKKEKKKKKKEKKRKTKKKKRKKKKKKKKKK